MKTYIIIDAETKTTAVFHVAKNEKLLDRLEETLYITQELEPYFRDWKSHLATFGWADFSYHCAEFFRVSYDWANFSFIFFKLFSKNLLTNPESMV